MTKTHTSFVCQQCGNESASWFGRCPSCGEWNSLVETRRIVGSKQLAVGSRERRGTAVVPQQLASIKHTETNRFSTGFAEFDRVLGGGIVPGGVILISGDPGVGKSTLLLAVMGRVGGPPSSGGSGEASWYVTGEESAEQVKMRASRLGISKKDLYILPETNIENILDAINRAQPKPQVLVIDSIQTMMTESLEGIAGSVGQIRQATQLFIGLAKRERISIFLVGHVTKEGTIAGPRLLEHMVDVVCYFEGERYYQGRILRSLKNRFGPTDEVGIFEMEEKGLTEISNPSKLFLENRVTKVPGSTVGVTLEGTRPLLVEIQSLVVPTQLAMPRRVVNGVDFNRLQVILAILQKRLNLGFGQFDVFVNVSGGLKLTEPAVDLPVALSLISAIKNKPMPASLASFGELGLLGELRRVQGEDKRLKEAKRLGFTTTVSPTTSDSLEKIYRTYFVA